MLLCQVPDRRPRSLDTGQINCPGPRERKEDDTRTNETRHSEVEKRTALERGGGWTATAHTRARFRPGDLDKFDETSSESGVCAGGSTT
jgi:hypothetical protein